MKKNKAFLLFILPILLLSCSRPTNTYKRSQLLMGTIVDITVVSDDEKKADEAIDAGFGEIKRLEQLMSTYIPDSNLSKINDSAGVLPVKADREVIYLIKKGIEFGDLTDGSFNITIGPLVKLWGIPEKGEFIPGKKEIEQLIPVIDYRNIQIDEVKGEVFLKKKGMKIDLGGIAKGYAADRAIVILKEKGIDNAIVAVAGDVKAIGKRPDGKAWHIGVRHPREKEKILGTIDLTDMAVSTSGDYERFFIKNDILYHHILDPRTGEPSRRSQSVTIIARDGIVADALSTGVFVLGPETGMALIERMQDMEGIIVDSTGKLFASSGMKEKFKLGRE